MENMKDDTISRQAAIEAIRASTSKYTGFMEMEMYTDDDAVEAIEGVPSAQPEQTKMIKEIRKWLNSGNRGKADYFIVDKIEEIINKYER